MIGCDYNTCPQTCAPTGKLPRDSEIYAYSTWLDSALGDAFYVVNEKCKEIFLILFFSASSTKVQGVVWLLVSSQIQYFMVNAVSRQKTLAHNVANPNKRRFVNPLLCECAQIFHLQIGSPERTTLGCNTAVGCGIQMRKVKLQVATTSQTQNRPLWQAQRNSLVAQGSGGPNYWRRQSVFGAFPEC